MYKKYKLNLTIKSTFILISNYINSESKDNENKDDETKNPTKKRKRAKINSTEVGDVDSQFKSVNKVFVGQIPFNATSDDVKQVFEEADGISDVKVRFLTDKRTGKPRGMAFVELNSPEEVLKALRLHHTVVKGRRINVERTVNGRGKSTNRKEYLLNINSDRNLKLSSKKKAYLNKLLSECGEDDNILTLEDLDERACSAMCVLPREATIEVVNEFLQHRRSARNPLAFLMGMLKKRRFDTPEGEPLTEEAAAELGGKGAME